MSVRLRFAPSPTGYLHVGGARTALFNWLYARRTGGKFLLRIEDTDKARSTDAHTQVILDGLTWLGLDWDEEPVFQGARIARHQAIADRLLKEDKAYVDEGAIRLRVPPGEIAWDDAVHERISFQGEDIKDWVILRADRTPLYNFAVVADDIDMQITHVLRGDDHISNTPKQIALYRALGASLPVFGHVPMINGPDGKKLSKRHGATAVGDYQHFGLLPEAMCNFLALLGWSPGKDRELFYDRADLVAAFSLEGILKKSAVFDMVKLQWMNSMHLRHKAEAAPKELAKELIKLIPTLATYGQRVEQILPVVVARSSTTAELAARVLDRVNTEYEVRQDPKAKEYLEKHKEGIEILRQVRNLFAHIPSEAWADPSTLEPCLQQIAVSLKKPVGEVYQPLRIVASGTTVSEPVHELLWAIGPASTMKRLDSFVSTWPNVPSAGAHVSFLGILPSAGHPEKKG